jgi:hypothetical protein
MSVELFLLLSYHVLLTFYFLVRNQPLYNFIYLYPKVQAYYRGFTRGQYA